MSSLSPSRTRARNGALPRSQRLGIIAVGRRLAIGQMWHRRHNGQVEVWKVHQIHRVDRQVEIHELDGERRIITFRELGEQFRPVNPDE